MWGTRRSHFSVKSNEGTRAKLRGVLKVDCRERVVFFLTLACLHRARGQSVLCAARISFCWKTLSLVSPTCHCVSVGFSRTVRADWHWLTHWHGLAQHRFEFLRHVKIRWRWYARRRSKIHGAFWTPFYVTDTIRIIQTGSYVKSNPKFAAKS